MNRPLLSLASSALLACFGCAMELPEGSISDANETNDLRRGGDLIADPGGTLVIDDFGTNTGGGRPTGPGGKLDPSQVDEVDIDAMEQSIRADLVNNVVGFAYVISQDGIPVRQDGWGDARRGADGDMDMSEHVPINVGSVSKPITAVATLKLLEANGMSIDDLISPWLPPEWAQGPGVEGLTFRHLLTHRTGWGQIFSGLSATEQDSWSNDWDGAAYAVSLGATPNATGSYKNMNYAVLRMIVPALWDASGTAPFAIPPLTEFNYGWYFVGYLQEALFEPAGVMDAGCWDLEGDQAGYGYDFDQPAVAGWAPGANIYHCGGHSNMLLSAMDLAAFMAHIRHDDAVFSPAARMLMDDYRLGWSSLSNTASNGRLGKFWHGGDMLVGSRETHACVMKYPQNIEAVLVVNSDVPKDQCSVLKDAFNNALP